MRTTDTTSTSSTTDRARIRRVLAAAAVGVLACGGMSACSAFTDKAKSTPDTGATTTSVPATSVVAPTTVDVAGDGGAQGSGTPGGGSSGNTGGGNTGNTGGGGNTPATPGPVIQSFTTPDDIDCHNGNLQEFTASWATQNATKVTISIDGPGVYDTYGASGSTSLPFNCSSAHTFLLTAYGADGRTATRQVTLQPRNAQTPDSGDSMP